MELFLVTLVVFLLAVIAMAVGVIVSDRCIKGSCGGIGALFGSDFNACEVCDKKDDCDAFAKQASEGQN